MVQADPFSAGNEARRASSWTVSLSLPLSFTLTLTLALDLDLKLNLSLSLKPLIAVGKTGYPMVDAGMRELYHSGWMMQNIR